ncbi:YajG family lipoprotein [Thalassomonas sp. M1454]|uniref:YajG family lipoprotein n=1 Tax=Thalassomonas sp. M1454 TaxID=2594477 RepID=UPI00163D9BED|nr:YajG family lipoprotein [Thalassomonas sp. M1454]
MFNKVFFICSIFLITACANEPTAIKLQPQVVNNQSKVYQSQAATIAVADKRNSVHLVEVLTNNEESKLIKSTAPLKSVLNTQFRKELASQGLQFKKDAPVALQFNVERARTYINQDVFDYRANTIIKLKVNVENPKQTLSKTFTLRATSRGPLTADIEEIQQDFNTQLAKIIVQVLEDEQLQNFIKG